MKQQAASGITRRDFLKLGGLTLSASILASCNRRNGISSMQAAPTLANQVPAYATAAAQPPPGGAADMILTNGKIFTVDPGNSITQALAIKDGLIQASGANEAIQALAGEATQLIDLAGRAVTPGLIDPHLHFRALGLNRSYYTPFMPPEVKDIPSLQRALAEEIKSRQPGEWIIGYYMILTDKPYPDKDDFDSISPDNPVFIMHIGGHWATANSAALELANVSAGTKSPDGGIIEMGDDGQPNGILYNHRAMDVVRRFAPEITAGMLHEAILGAQQLMASCGVTSFQDNNIRDLDDIRAYQEMTQSGELFLRNDLYLTFEWPADLAKLDQVNHLNNEMTRFAGYKFLIDGQGPTAYCHEKHNGKEWRMPTWEPQLFKDTVRSLHDTGLQICVHTIGDAAADLVLEAYEAAMDANPRSDPRHRIEHAILTTPQATQKMKDLGVAVSTQPAFLYLFGDGWQNLFGENRMQRILVTREWLEAGVHLAIGSDAPSTPLYHPQASLAGTMNRLTFQETALGDDQALSFEEALRAHTYEAAYVAHEENVKGTLEAGKYADLAVWKEDPSALSLEELSKTITVDMTLVGGKIVYQG